MNIVKPGSAGFFKRRKILKSVNALDLIPIQLVNHEITAEGLIKLIIPRFSNKLLLHLFTGNRLTPEFKISLDETGSKVWQLIDGIKTAGEIAANLVKIFENKDLKLDSAEERVVAFISRLYQEDYITFRQIKE
jgi:hypothetical protein